VDTDIPCEEMPEITPDYEPGPDFDFQKGQTPAEQINAELDQLTARVYVEPEAGVIKLWSFAFDAEETLAVYAALRTYMRALASQESEDLEMLARIVALLQRIKPGAIKASKHLSLKAVGK